MAERGPSVGEALRSVRKALGLRQVDFGARILVGRETISSWEQGGTAPTYEQRVIILKQLADVAPQVLAPLVEALGVVAPRGVARGAARADVTARALAAIRAAADELDVPASGLRRTMAVVLAHLGAARVPLEDAAAALAARKR
jgi:transcriptional regulator with XRE-family HTH domain